ncbi:ATPase [Paenibacillus nanensis]|uniref:ATPase n=1 Tax=Paenibacillus nanensis TaxID=393251 RepID=A0A3A1UVT4_9BACL|nr:BadF/BadG/BcrA/BcrD ATPase family protein [Paenibacillus nanensis]RIX51541.1 ATPase [Paenibacillus nanensis]
MDSSVVIGIDGGGTHTRVMVCDLSGNQLAYLEGSGAASYHKDRNAAQNVQQAILDALDSAGRRVEDVRQVAAGIAGYDNPEDLTWIAELTDVPGLSCPKLHVNDAVSAHAGALLARPGIVAISGTGSIILGITEAGRQIRNYDFHHYAASAARFIAYDAVFEALAGNRDVSDGSLLLAMLRHFEAGSLEQLAELARQGFHSDRRERDKRFGQFAPYVTEAAEHGSSIATLVLNRAAAQLKTGIELIAAGFDSDDVQVALIGSVISSPYLSRTLTKLLADGRNKRYIVTPPELEPVAGSVLLALKALGLPATTITPDPRR